MTSDTSARGGMVQRISAALDHIDQHGSLKGFASSDEDGKALIAAATAQGLMQWNSELKRHQLSATAQKWVKVFFHRRR
jgi:hypothetical protein